MPYQRTRIDGDWTPKRFQKPCETCGILIWAYPSQIALGMKRYCSRTCKPGHPKGSDNPSWKGGKSLTKNGYVRTYIGDGRYVLEHRQVLLAKIGPGTHPCHWCGTPVTWTDSGGSSHGELVTDHIDTVKTNNDPGNLVPSCQPCNVNRGRTDLVPNDVPHMIDSHGWKHRAEERICQRCGNPLLIQTSDKRPNRGLYCSRSCARKQPRHP